MLMLYTTGCFTTSDETSQWLYVKPVLIVFENSLKQWFYLIDYSENKITENENEFYHIQARLQKWGGITNE